MKFKVFILSISFVLFVNFVFSGEFSGTVRYIVTHNWIKQLDSYEFISQADRERYAYVWGQSSEWSEYSILKFNTNSSYYSETGERPGHSVSTHTRRKDEYMIYRNFDKNLVYDVKRILGTLYLIEDTIQHQKWRILNDMREIAGHICMNAEWVDTVRNHRVIAWFALDLPVSAGPERYGGLPGLILAINVNNGAYSITAEKVELSQSQIEIELPRHRRRINKITESEYRQIIYDYIREQRRARRGYFYGGGIRY